MNTKNSKRSCLRIIVIVVVLAVLLIVVLFLASCLFLDYADTMHKVSVNKIMLERFYSVLTEYREAHGQWPNSIGDATTVLPSMSSFTGVDSIFHRPWLYYPNAKPSSKEVLAAVPDVIRMHWLPFVGWQDAVLADGTFVDFRSSRPALKK
jgi:hypothetical protein